MDGNGKCHHSRHGRKDSVIDTVRHEIGRESAEPRIFTTRMREGDGIVTDTGKNGLGRNFNFVFFLYGQERVMASYRTWARTGKKTWTLTGVGTNTGERGQCFVFPPTWTETDYAILPDTDKNGRGDMCIVADKIGHGRERVWRLAH
ncbi:hypothetical protein QAD02_002899 [Eretmocerus hayati]|uniref:Uncharacterized protein n=1 Tax=Eretmocerus hayati TaxID=131215 RepID=A0ACC2NQ38_9HYME|nr:hypothetical protein QAD02_002899 [Eretmocerus hayati]